jgi:putative sterol carrier protein
MTDEEIAQQTTSEETEQQLTSEEIIQKMIDKFHRRMAKDEKARAEVEPIVKRFNVDLGEETFHMRLEKAQVVDFEPGLYDEADILLKTTPEYLQQLIEGTLRPMRAYVTKKITIKGKIEDILHLKKFF